MKLYQATLNSFSQWLRFLIRIVYRFLLLLFLPKANPQPKRLLIVKLDVIGDYVLFRNFLKELRISKQYSQYNISLCGNQVWRDFAENFDSESIDDFVWVNHRKFWKNRIYRFHILKKIRFLKVDTVIHPVHSRDYSWGDQIVRYSGAVVRIAAFSDLSSMTQKQRAEVDSYYTEILPETKKYQFEFDRNREMFEFLLNKKISLKKPYFDMSEFNVLNEYSNYCIITPGASKNFRCWSALKFAQLAGFIQREFGLLILICGTANDQPKARAIMSAVNEAQVVDLTGKTSLTKLTELLSQAQLIITNDTAAVHIAMVTGNNRVVCISNGNHYGRFVPYEKMMLVVPPVIEAIQSEEERIRLYYEGSTLDINEIQVSAVEKAVKQILTK